MNAGGGTLLIGVADDGEVIGIQPDLDFKRHDPDGYENWLTTLLSNRIGEAPVASHVKIQFDSSHGEVVCLVSVEPSDSEVFAESSKGEGTFYVRMGNTTRVLHGYEMTKYIRNRFTS
jgi:predicted HTH transcriptional regulator